jgi:hypothetical protein
LRIHAKGFFPNYIEAGLRPKTRERERATRWKEGFLNPLTKGLGPSSTGSIFQTLSRNFGSGVFPVEVATLSPRWLRQKTFRNLSNFSAIELARGQVGK